MEKKSKKNHISRNQLLRLARISSLLQRNCFPTPEVIVKEYRDMELYEGIGHGGYSIKTAIRDIHILKNDFGCPIKYKRSIPGYYLSKPGWKFVCPTDLSEPAMLTMIIGAKVVEDIFPAPLNTQVKSAVDEILKGNNPDFLDSACVKSLKIFAESNAVEISRHFPQVFEAWLRHRSLMITYCSRTGEITERIVDPHVLFLYNKQWQIKAYCHRQKAPRTFVINRISSAELLKETFEPDLQLIDSVTLDDIVSYPKVKDVKILLERSARNSAIANKMHSGQVVTEETEGKSWLFYIPEVPKEVIIPWILSQGGEAIPLEPQEIVDEVKLRTAAILQRLA